MQRHIATQQDRDNDCHPPRANPGEGSGGHQLSQVAGETAKETSGGKDGVGKEDRGLATKDVAQTTVEGLKGGECEEVSGTSLEKMPGRRRMSEGKYSRCGDPANVVERFQLAADLAGAAHDERLVCCGEHDLEWGLARIP